MVSLKKTFSKIPKILIIIPIILILMLLSLILTNTGKNETGFDQFYMGAKNKITPQELKKDPIEPLIQNALASLPPKYAIFIKNLKSQKEYVLNPNQVFPSASIYKLAVMYKTYDAIESGQLQKNEILSSTKVTLDKKIAGNQNQSPPLPKDSKELVSLTVENALNLMITVSDNSAG